MKKTIGAHIISWTAAVMVVAGLLWLAVPAVQRAQVRHQGTQKNTQFVQQAQQEIAVNTDTALTLGVPVELFLPRLGMALQIKPGHYNTSTASWTLDREHVFMMQPPAQYTELPTPIIYGHNIPAVFQKLEGVAENEVLRVKTQDGRELLFRYVGDRVVLPNDNTVLSSKLPNSILLMTCTGAQFQHRRVLQFEYLGSKPITVTIKAGDYEHIT